MQMFDKIVVEDNGALFYSLAHDVYGNFVVQVGVYREIFELLIAVIDRERCRRKGTTHVGETF